MTYNIGSMLGDQLNCNSTNFSPPICKLFLKSNNNGYFYVFGHL